MVLMRTIVRLRRFSSDPTRAARSAIDGSCPSSRRSASRAASSSRRWRRTPRGHASRRSASIIAPRTRRSANVSNLMPRSSSNRCAASIRPQHAVLNQIADVDRVRHRGGHAARERLDKGQAGDDAAVLAGGDGLGAHVRNLLWRSGVRRGAAERCASSQRRYQLPSLCTLAGHTRLDSACKLLVMMVLSRWPGSAQHGDVGCCTAISSMF